MKLRNVFAAGLIAASLLPTFAKAADITFDVVSTPVVSGTAAKIEFKGNPFFSIAFPNAGDGFDFKISNGSNSAFDGLSGNIGGTFTVGAITGVGYQTAPVTGTGIFSITDSSNNKLTADLTWDVVFSSGAALGLNFNAVSNLSNIQYTGSNAALQSIVTSIDPAFNITAQFGRAKSLKQLMTAGATNSTTYSGSFIATQPVPEPSTYALMAAGLAVAGIAARRRKSA